MWNLEWQEFSEKVNYLFKKAGTFASVEINENQLTVNIQNQKVSYSKDEFSVETSEAFDVADDCRLQNQVYYEVLLDTLTPSPIIMRRYTENDDFLHCSDDEFEFRIGSPSHRFIIDALIKSIELNDFFPYRIEQFVLNPRRKDKKPLTLFDLLVICCRLQPTLSIRSNSTHSASDFKQVSNAYLFCLAYNTGIVFTQLSCRQYESGFSHGFSTHRKVSFGDIEPPKRKYNESLVNQYLKAMSANDPFISYLCFYHIIENFFEEIYKQDIVETIRREITSPKFSAKRGRDIVSLVDIIQNRLRKNSAEYLGTEQESLELTLKKFIPDLQILHDELARNGDQVLLYYKKNQVPFSKGDEIDFSIQAGKVYSKIAARIYKTRNAIVHSKSNELRTKERAIYEPLNDEAALFKELALLQAIAELVIIGDSEML